MRSPVIPLLATGLVAAVLPWGAAPAYAEEKKPFSGYSTAGHATPVKLEIYEPTIPVPATPQLELSFGYSTVEADSSSGQGRSSFLWPGDPIGEGLKTIVEQLGLPPELSGPIAAQGYPLQVNSEFPAGPEATADEPFPGLVMRTSAEDGAVSASTGFSTDCDVSPPASSGGGAPGIPGLPSLPSLPGLPGLAELPVLGSLAGALPGLSGSAAPPAGAPQAAAAPAVEPTPEVAAACQIPPALNALVDLGGYISTSRSRVVDGKVVTTSRSSLGDVRLLGGIVTVSGIHATATSSSDGKTGTPEGEARFGTVTIAGQEFAFGPEGYRALGRSGTIPGLPDDPAKALKTLGITLTLPTPERISDGDKASTAVSALQVEIDTVVLSPLLRQLPLAQILENVPFPPEAAILKSLLGALPNLAPRVVLTLGSAESEVDTVQGIALPDLPTDAPETPAAPGGDQPADPGAGDGAGAGAPGGAGGTGAGAAPGGAPAGAADPGADSGAVGDLPAAAPVAAGLPPLFSIPGLLLLGGIALAAVAGSYLRRLGAAALGGGASCSHGLDSGLPDLRKA